MWHLSETEEKACTPSVMLTTGLHQKRNISLQTVEKLVCSDWGGWLRNWLRIIRLFFFSPSILLLIIYSSSKYTCNVEKGTLFEITDLLNPCFFLQLYKFFLKHKFGVSFPSDAEKTFKNINKLIKIVTFVHFLYQFKTQCKIQWRDPEY